MRIYIGFGGRLFLIKFVKYLGFGNCFIREWLLFFFLGRFFLNLGVGFGVEIIFRIKFCCFNILLGIRYIF